MKSSGNIVMCIWESRSECWEWDLELYKDKCSQDPENLPNSWNSFQYWKPCYQLGLRTETLAGEWLLRQKLCSFPFFFFVSFPLFLQLSFSKHLSIHVSYLWLFIMCLTLRMIFSFRGCGNSFWPLSRMVHFRIS